jgi:nucleoside-diphosphate-sugar epimerase/predicted dehydrogenase
VTDRLDTASKGPTLRAALVGAGLISDIHATGLSRAGAQVLAIVDADERRAREKAERHGIEHVFTTQRAMLDAMHPDLVHVLTPPASHAALCVEAMEAGAHVYVEKPMASTVEECDRMIAASERTGKRLCVGHSLVYDPVMQRALTLLANGELGEVLHASATYAFDPARIPGYRNKAWYRHLSGGFLEDLLSHPASVLFRLVGDPRHITFVGDRRPAQASREVAALIDGARASAALHLSLDARPEDVSVTVRCTKGTLRADFSAMTLVVQRERKLPKKLASGVRNFETAAQLAVQTVTSTVRVATKRTDTTKGIHSLIEAFVAALRDGGVTPVSGSEGRAAIALARTLWPAPSLLATRPPRWVLSRGTDDATSSAAELPTALVTGATGFIGRHLVRDLAQRGVRVRALARDPERARDLAAPNVEVMIGDFADAAVIDGLADGIDTVFHLASVMKGTADEFERVDLAGGRRLLAESKRAGVRRFVFTSTMGAFKLGGLRDGSVVTEEMSDEPERVGHYSRAKLLMERELLAANRAGEIEAVITRPGLVFGPGISPYLEHLPHVGSFKGDRYTVFGDGEVPLQLTYVGNVVDALWRCATSSDAPGHVFTIIDDGVPTQREFVRRLARLTGRPLHVKTIPRPAAWLIGLGVETAAGALRIKPPTTRGLLLGKTAKLSFDCSRAKRVLGWTPAVGWEEGLRRAVAWDEERKHALSPDEKVLSRAEANAPADDQPASERSIA